MYKCPITDKPQLGKLEELMELCRKHECSFVDSDHNTDFMPSNCILLVSALIYAKNKD